MKIFIGIIGFLLVMSSFASDNPSFDNGILTIPSVDSEGKSGLYQNVVFQLSEKGNWELHDGNVGIQIQDNAGGTFKTLQNIEIIKIDSFPIQVFLKVEGEFTNGCSEVGQINHQFKDNKFEVFVYYKNDNDNSSGEFACTANIVPFEKIIALPVYSLKSGEYEVVVNGLFSRTFSLSVDNEL